MGTLTRRDVLEWAMAESVPVRCPACRREHRYAAQSYPCVCGVPVAPSLDALVEPTVVTVRAWDDEWATVRCGACARETQWPHPELGCDCGTMLRIPVRAAGALPPARDTGRAGHDGHADGSAEERTGHDLRGGLPVEGDSRRPPGPGHPSGAECLPAPDRAGDGTPPGTGEDRPRDDGSGTSAGVGPDEDRDRAAAAVGTRHAGAGGRAPFRPVTVRTARDAVTAAALYLRWLGYPDVRRADQRPPSGIGLAARGILAQVDPTVRPASLRDVECLWLTAMTESAACVYFSLAGYAEDALARADALGVPLFVLDLTGTPQPVNSPADDLIAVAG
ncbi:hypothetical protein ACIRQH_32705 [Streptomyces sp. NPDC102279]|uniref:hypothetical protein n=1 Tax=Streptomyces sp. NPDC102279 TaxID=3366153 RepID=UPI003802D1A9